MLPGGTPAACGPDDTPWRVSLDRRRSGRRCTPLMMIAGEPGRGMPGPIVGHWTFNREYPAVEIGDDEEERGLSVGHRPLCYGGSADKQLGESVLSMEPSEPLPVDQALPHPPPNTSPSSPRQAVL